MSAVAPPLFIRAKVVLDWFCVLALALVFAWAGMAKWGEAAELREAIGHYRLVGEPFAGWVALLLPPLEITVALGLVLQATRRLSAGMAAVLVMGFATATLQAWGRGIDPACGCFGDSGPSAPVLHLLLWLGMLAASAWLWSRSRGDHPRTST